MRFYSSFPSAMRRRDHGKNEMCRLLLPPTNKRFRKISLLIITVRNGVTLEITYLHERQRNAGQVD